jgi:integrase
MMKLRNDTRLWGVCLEHYFPLNPTIQHAHTRCQYKFAIDNLSSAIGRQATLADLTDDNINRMMRYLLDQGLAPRTINERRGRINCLWSWLSKRGWAKGYPTTQRIPEPQRTPQAWTQQQLTKLFHTISTLPGRVGGVPANHWWTALLLTCWDSGERIGALLNIGWDQVDLESRWLVIPAEMRKGKRRDMAYRLAPDTVEALSRLPRKGKVFEWPYSPGYIWQKYEAILKSAGLPHDRRSKFHRVRRSFASHLKAAGGDPQSAMGHSSWSVTVAYLDPRIATPEQPVDRLFRPGA